MVRPRRTVGRAGLTLVAASTLALLAVSANASPSAPGSAAKKPRALVAPPVERLVLGPADTPGLKAKRGSAAQGARAVVAALRPARYRAPRGAAKASRFVSPEGQLWSLAYIGKSSAAAKSDITRVAVAVKRAGLIPGNATTGQQGYIVESTQMHSTLVAWRRGSVVGELLLRTQIPARLRRTIALQYATVADDHIAHLASLDAWQRTLGSIRPNGAVPRSVALGLFALAYVPLPGTKRPQGRPGRPEGSLAAREILRIWTTLTPAQQAAAAKALGITGVNLGKGKAWRVPGAVHARADYGDPTFKPDAALTAKIQQYVAIYANRLTPKLNFTETIVAGTSQEKSDAWADTLTVDTEGEVNAFAKFCRVRLLPIGQAEKNPDFRELALAHEAFHCIQDEVMTPVGAVLVNRRNWLLEGSADWAAITIRQPIAGRRPGRTWRST